MLYNRGYIHEKLCETGAAIADYSQAITTLEKAESPKKRQIKTFLIRTEHKEKAFQMSRCHDYDFIVIVTTKNHPQPIAKIGVRREPFYNLK